MPLKTSSKCGRLSLKRRSKTAATLLAQAKRCLISYPQKMS